MDGPEECTAFAFAFLVGQLLTGVVQALVEPAVVPGQEAVVVHECGAQVLIHTFHGDTYSCFP